MYISLDELHSEEDNFVEEDLINNGEKGETELSSKAQSDDEEEEGESDSEMPSAILQFLGIVVPICIYY